MGSIIDNEPWPIILGTQIKPTLGKTRAAIPRLSRTDGDETLYVTLLCIKGLHGDMLIIHSSNLRKEYSKQSVN